MKIVLSIAFVFIFQVSGILAQAGSEKFWDSLKTNCGKAFAGEIIHAPENDSFRGKKLVMHVRSCEENEIKIPFFVGEDRSRTWILTKIGDRIRLKHDHRHKDGTPDKITMYGGTASNGGSATRQVFPADEETRRMLPAAASNVWWIDLAKESFTYNLRRVGTDRYFSIKFDLTKTVHAPPAPWGWDKNVPRRITYDEKQDRYPSFSPDGKKILFESNRRNFWGIYTMETDGTNISEVSRVRAEMRFPSWNQDGTRIIYSGKQGVNFSVYHMRADGTDIRRFMKGFMGIFATWSPDGKSIAFTSLFGGKPDVYLLDIENSVRAPLVATRFRDVWLRWSPDGKKVAFFSRRDTNDEDDEIYVMDFPNGTPKRITNRKGHDFCPSWAPDGKRLAVAAVDEKLGRSINIIDLEGNILSRHGLGFERVTEPNWSPDGKQIIYAARKDGNYDIYVERISK